MIFQFGIGRGNGWPLELPAVAVLGFCAWAVLGSAASGLAQDFSLVPGTVIDHLPKSSGEYVGSPSIVILPNGDYIASHDRFGPSSSFTSSAVTQLFRSTDQGATWSPLSTLQGQGWSNLFVQGNDLYIMGVNKEYGRIVLRKSTNGGANWTNPTTASNGFLTSINGYHTAPMPIVEHDGRLWRAFEDTFNGGGWPRQFRSFVMSAPIGSNLLDASNWTFSNALVSDTSWVGGQLNGWLEGGVVVNPNDELVNMLRVDNLPLAATVTVDEANHSVAFDPSDGFIDFPGGATKFSVRYDPQSDKYWTLSNPVLPQYQGSPPGSTRNALALMSSSDLRAWNIESVLLYHPDTAKHGFQYVDWQFDGNDLIAASRTAFDDGLGGANNYHDANLLTFHRVDDFRTLSPSQALVADTNNDRILRYQANSSGEWVPLGSFVTSNAPGQPLDAPMGLVQDANGFVFVGEQKDGGRILRFDAGGNFIDVVATEGIEFHGRPEALAMGPNGKLLLSAAFGSNSDRILQIDTKNHSVTTLVDTTFVGGSLNNPRGIAVDDTGNLYVANREGDAVLKFDGTSGAFLGNLWNIDNPQDLAWDATQSRLITSALSSTDLFAVDTNGVATKLYDPSDIGAVLGLSVIDGEVFWTDYTNGTVSRLVGVDQRETVASGLSGPGHLIGVTAPKERTWRLDATGVWQDPNNWQSYWGIANSAEEIAVLGPGLSAPRTIVLDSDESVGGVRFLGNHAIAVAGVGRLSLAGGPLQVFAGDHQFQVEVQLVAEVIADIAGGASLAFNNRLLLSGNDLHKIGQGELNINGEVVADGGAIILEEGSINGNGILTGSLVDIGGTVSPGHSPGRLTIQGDFTEGERGDLHIELAGTNSSQYDQLIVGGQFEAKGSLSVVLLAGFTPSQGDVFDIVSYGSLQSVFARVELPELEHGLAWRLSKHIRPGTLRLSVVSVPEPNTLLLCLVQIALGWRGFRSQRPDCNLPQLQRLGD